MSATVDKIKQAVFERLTQRGMTLDQLRAKINEGQNYVVQISDDFNVSVLVIDRIATALDLDYDALLLGEVKEISESVKLCNIISSATKLKTYFTEDISIVTVGELIEKMQSRGYEEGGLVVLYIKPAQ